MADVTANANPSNIPANTLKRVSNGTGDFKLLQDDEQVAFVANPTDLATALTAIIAIRNALVTAGIMRAS